jgi:hypothetical protein
MAAILPIVPPPQRAQFSTEWDFTVGSPQWTFIKQALTSVNRTETPWGA